MSRKAVKQSQNEQALERPTDCLCANLRRSARALTQIYDDALSACDLTVSQFWVLCVLSEAQDLTMQALAARLGMDRTTLTRALGPLTRAKLVRSVSGEDRREKRVALTSSGLARLSAARPAWRKAQRRIIKAFGTGRSAELLSALRDVRKAAD